MLSNNCFQVIITDKTSTQMQRDNGLLQGSVLDPLLFSCYMADMSETSSKKFGYTDDWTLETSHKELENTEQILTNRRLQPNAAKTEVSCVHKNNNLANSQLKIYFDGRFPSHNKHLKNLGTTLERGFEENLTKTTAKLKITFCTSYTTKWSSQRLRWDW